MKKLILDARSSGNIEFGFVSAVGGVCPCPTVADVGLSAAAEVIIPGLTIKHIVSSVPDEEVVSCTSQDDCGFDLPKFSFAWILTRPPS